jgi:PAS domain S-box-containing protein
VSKKYKILIVDDEAINVAVLTSYLSKKYTIITASNGEIALETIKKEEPDLILLDVIMPGIDGFDVCKSIKQDAKFKFVPVVMLTILAAREYHQKGIEVGADDFLKKPANEFELNEKIKALLRIKEQHDSLRTDRNKAYEYLDYVGALVAVLNLDNRLIHINKKGADILGYSRHNIINRDWIDLFVAESYAEYVASKYNSMKNRISNDPECHEYPIMTITRKERLFKWYDSVLKDDDGKVTSILISGEDITEKRKDEIKLMEYAYQMKRSNDIKDLFTDVLRHDLLNPAGLVKSFTEILEDTELNEKQKHVVDNIKLSNMKLINLIEDAAQLAKLESIDEMVFVKIDIVSIINDVLETFRYEMTAKRIETNLILKDSYFAYANPMIQGVFSNLISNSIKYSPENSTITITVEDIGSRWKVSIADEGDGIPNKDKMAVFDRFNRLHKESIKGNGIGLAIVKRIINLHEESVEVIDNPAGKGSIFWFTLKKAQ